jgi:hypothetical protein
MAFISSTHPLPPMLQQATQATTAQPPRFSGVAPAIAEPLTNGLTGLSVSQKLKTLLPKLPNALLAGLKEAFLNPKELFRSAALGTVAMLVSAPFLHVVSPMLIPAWMAIDMTMRGIKATGIALMKTATDAPVAEKTVEMVKQAAAEITPTARVILA